MEHGVERNGAWSRAQWSMAFIGATNAELLAIQNREITMKEIYVKLGSNVTNYHRESVG
ncbi:MAG: hypothetical protein IKK33_15445 [Lachnospiraceae bacterium]|nr:hypothetical protein [Lachnospiraceae bacterium]